MTDTAAPATAAPAPVSRAYRTYMLTVMVVVYTSNFIDRSLLGVLGQPIKADLKLQDWQLGMLGGLAFALLYSFAGLGVARLAEHKPRATIISTALAIWSAMTALCGAATGFWTLALARVGVGLGEAGYIPPAYSLIADYYPPQKRASALGIFTLGVPFGAFLGATLGGALAQAFGWRVAFLALGLPGLAVALLFKLTVREPVRGGMDAAAPAEGPPPSFGAVLAMMLRKRALVHLTLGASLTSFSGYAFAQFAIPFLLRGFPLDLRTAALAYGVFGALSAAIGVGCGGYLADAAGRKDPRWRAWIPGFALMAAAPLFMLALTQPTVARLGALVIVPLILQYLYLGPVFALVQNLVDARSRATATAVVNVSITLIGLGLGPMTIGALSDLFAGRSYPGLMPFVKACPGGVAPPGAQGFAAEACHAASFAGLQQALIAAAAIYIWAGLHFVLAARSLRKDLGS
ncbi:MAG TPA: MFS transporter [Caulobacteraceae bacterium]|nr:MFS transporter [Caulobacteraceae bacterium]